MDVYRVMQLFVFVIMVGLGNGLMRPFFRVSGMSDQLPNLCVVDYNDQVNISIEVTYAGCDNETFHESITSIEWKFYRLHSNNMYTINISDPYKHVTEKSSSISWNSLSTKDMNIYAVEASVELTNFTDNFTIMGYVVIGCGDLSQNAQKICLDVKQSVNSLAGNMEQIWHLGKCFNTVSTYEATSTVEFDVLAKRAGPDYTVNNLYTAGLHLENKTTVIFQVKCESDAFVLLQEIQNDVYNNVIEIEIGGLSNQKSLIRNKQTGSILVETKEAGLLSKVNFRYFWISFAGEEIRVGKGGIPYVDEFLRWTSLTHDINYIAIGNGPLIDAIWKFDIDLCMQPSKPGVCKKNSKWYYRDDSATCERTCGQSDNCFQTEHMCQVVCGTQLSSMAKVTGIPYGDVCTGASQCTTIGAECLGSPSTCSCNTLPVYHNATDTCLPAMATVTGIPYGDVCTGANQCTTTGAECLGSPSTCSCNTLPVYHNATDTCLPELNITIRCVSNCWQEQNPLRRVKYTVESEQFTDENITYKWTVKECVTMDTNTCQQIVKTKSSVGLSFKRNAASVKDFYGVFIQVSLPDGREANASVGIKFSPVPQAGQCTVSPVTGYILITDFNVTCQNFSVAGTYSLTYRMRSNTINKWKKGKQFYLGAKSTLTGVKFPQGDAHNLHRLFIFVKAYIESGAFVFFSSMIQVLPSSMAPPGSSVMETAKSLVDVDKNKTASVIDEMIEAGNQHEAVQYLNIISSSLNSDNTTNSTEETQDKTQVRTAVVASLEKVNISNSETLFIVAQTLNEVTKVSTELSESTQDQATDMFVDLADSLETYINGTSDVTDIVESAEEIFTGVTQLLDIKVDEGTKQISENKTKQTDSVKDDAKMEKVKNSTGKLLNTVNKIGSTLLSSQNLGDPAIVFQTGTMYIKVEKILKDTLIGHILAVNTTAHGDNNTAVTSLKFPSVVDTFNENMSDVGVQMLHMKKNPYVWDESASEVNMEVMSVDLQRADKSEVSIANLSEPLKITFSTPEALDSANNTLILHVIKNATNVTFDLSNPNMLTSQFTIQEGKTTTLSLNSESPIKKFKVFISENVKPTFDQVMDLGVTYPDQSSLLSKNYSRFDLSNDTVENSTLIYFTYNNTMDLNYTGVYFLGVTVDLENKSVVADLQGLDSECLGNVTVVECAAEVEITLQVKTVTLACTYWDKPSQTWSDHGCEVAPYSTQEQLECLCTHMTAFSGGVFVLPNVIDPLGDAALFLTFFDNPVVVTAVIVVWILYFFLIHWARQADKRDQERVGVIAVGDVDTNSKYLYLVCIVTGWWTDAGTTANVFFYLKGTDGSSKRTKLTTSTKLCFQTGYEDWFLISTEESLGELQDVTLWHDNTGTSPHWYLSQVFVKDLQEKRSWTFIYNDWLAVDRGTVLQTTASVAAVTREQLKMKQKHNFMVKTTQDLRDTHLWLSIFSKPARSTFTRVQRVTCALSLLLTTMLTNIMFYGIPTDDPEDQVGGARGVVISLSSIVIGIQSSLIMFPLNVIIMQMFLKLKQRPVQEEVNQKQQSYVKSLYERASILTTDILLGLAASSLLSVRIEEKMEQKLPSEFSVNIDESDIKKESCVDVESSSSFVTAATDSEPVSHDELGHSIEVTYSGSVTSDTFVYGVPSNVTDRIASSKSGSSGIVVLSESKQTGKILPWWFLYITWSLVLGVSMVCSYFVMLYGLKYGYQRSVEWLVSFLTGFSQSALITQPLKVLAVAMVVTLIFKRTVEFEDYGPEVRLDEDEVFVNSVNNTEETHIPYSQPLSSKLLKLIQKRVQLEWLMDMTLRDIVLYIVYIVVVCIVVHGHRDIKEAYYNSVAIEDVLVNPGCINLNLCFFLAKVDNVETFYKYLYEVAVPNLADMSIADHDYATPGSSHFLVGPWRLRQLRVERGTCGEGADRLFKQFSMNVPECSGPYWLGDEEKQNFNGSWSEPSTLASDPPTMWTYQSAWKLKTIPFKGKLATYSGAGYIVTMPRNQTLHEGIIQDMWNTDWIDERTRAVCLEFTLYNPNADLFSVVIILFEFSNNGAVFPYHQIFSTRLYHYSTDFAIFVAVCECLFLIFNISFAYYEWKKFSVLGKKQYLEDYWSYVEIIQILLSFTVVGLFFQRLISVSSVMEDFREADGDTFISFYSAISWDLILGYVMAFLVALVTLKAIKLLKFNKRTYMVADTITHSKSSILSFLALAVLVTMAFGHFATMAFGRIMEDYRDMLTSVITIFNFAMGVSDLHSLQETNRILGPVYFVLFVFVITFIFLTVFVAILNFGISDSKALFENRQNKFELMEYVIKKMKVVLNVKQ